MTVLDSIVEYFRMGGYAFYIWGSYAIVFVVLALNLVIPSIRLRRVRRALARELRLANSSQESPAQNDR